MRKESEKLWKLKNQPAKINQFNPKGTKININNK